MSEGTPDSDSDSDAPIQNVSFAPTAPNPAAGADVEFFVAEAAAHSDGPTPSQAAPLLYAAGVLYESVADYRNAAAAYGDARASDPTFVAAWWPLRRLLANQEDGPALLRLFDVEVANSSLPLQDRADLWVARGHLLEDRLLRPADAAVSYRAALELAPDHPAALLSLLASSSRLGEASGVESAIMGIVRLCPDGPVSLLAELEQLARFHEVPRARLLVLDRLAAVVGRLALASPEQAATAAALLREKARLLRDNLFEPRAAFEVLLHALRFAPTHPLLAEELMDAGSELGRGDVADEILTAAAGSSPSIVIETVLRQVEMMAAEDRAADALALLDRFSSPLGGDARVSAARSLLLARQGDVAGMVDTFTDEGGRQEGHRGAHAYVRAGTLAQWVLNDQRKAEFLYQHALALEPRYRPAVKALALFYRDAFLRGGQASDGGRALDYQHRLIALGPVNLANGGRGDVRVWVRARDLELAEETQARLLGRPPEQIETVRAIATVTELADRAGDRATAAALRIEAARMITSSARDRGRAERLLMEARGDDRTGLAAAELEALLADPASAHPGRTDREATLFAVLAEELAKAEKSAGDREVARALRYRLAFHQAALARWTDAVASLRPLSDGGDALARAWSWDLARSSRDAAAVVALLGEEGGGAGLGLPTDLAEAMESVSLAGAEARYAKLVAETPSVDAALGLLRCALVKPAGTMREVLVALRAVADVLSSQPGDDDQRVAAALRRDTGLLAAAMGQPDASSDASSEASRDATGDSLAAKTLGDAIEEALLRWIAGVRGGDPEKTAGALLDIGLALMSDQAGARAEAIPLLARAAARARLGGGNAARRIGAAAWQAARGVPALAALSDVPAAADGQPADSWAPDVRAARAGFSDGPLSVVLDLEHGLEAELQGRLGQALDAYARVVAVDGERLEAMEGIRRVARAAGDRVGQARALARLGTLVRRSGAAAEMFTESARLFEDGGRVDDAIALHWHALCERPEDEETLERLSTLLASDLDAPGRAAGFERLLGHKLARLRPDGPARIPLLLQRGLNRLRRLNQREDAIQDFKRILSISPENEDALRELSSVALTDAAPGEAVELLQRYLAVVRDDGLAAQARLDLARAYEASQDIGQAIEILHQASSVRPADGQPRQQLSELSLRAGDWHSAVDTLRAWEQTISEPARKAQLHLRVGALLRDRGNDPRGAAMSFQLAATLDPMGDGAFALIALYESLGDSSRRHDVIRGQIIELRRSLERDPIDVPRLRRLRDLLEREALGPGVAPGATHPMPAAAVPVKQILALFGEVPEMGEPIPAARPLMGPGLDRPDFWAHLASPGAAGFLAEVWSHLGEAVARTFPADPNKLGLSRQTHITSAAEPRLGWVETSAAALGLTTLAFHVPAQSMGEGDAEVMPVELPEPALVLDRAALAGGMGARFRFGRALALLHMRASLLDRGDAPEVRQLFLAAKAIAAAPGAPVDAATPVSLVKALGKVIGRKEKRALGSLAQRFESDPLDGPAWQHAVLRTADRLGLVVAGDIAAALRVIVDFSGQAPVADQLNENLRALELLRFALSERYLKLRDQVGLGEP